VPEDPESEAPTEAQDEPFVAYSLVDPSLAPLEPASRWRAGMDALPERWPNRCLPLLVANESGCVIRLPQELRVSWNGMPGATALTVEGGGGLASSGFGVGILTFAVPYVFRTPPGWDLLVRGPVNEPKDAIAPLEGVVESDWIAAPFTMNWQVTRPDTEVVFAPGEVFCHVVPVRRWDLERLAPRLETVAAEPDLAEEVQHHTDDRRAVQQMKAGARLLGYRDDFWDQKYFRGKTPKGESALEHRTKRRLRPFAQGPEG
jgi:hypothetical protein